VLDVLDVEDDGERDNGEGRGPEAEVAGPDAGKVFNLECRLDGRGGDEGAEGCLQAVSVVVESRSCITSYQLRIKVPIAFDVLRRTCAVQVPQGARAADNPPRSDDGNPDVEEARRKVEADGAEGAPTLAVTA
jgi:hypothetical protein